MMLLKTLLGLLVAFLAVVDAQVELSGPCNSYDREKLNEGYYKCVYKDPVGIPTIGVGFNLEKANAREEIESFSGFSVGFCINEEEGYLLPTIARKID